MTPPNTSKFQYWAYLSSFSQTKNTTDFAFDKAIEFLPTSCAVLQTAFDAIPVFIQIIVAPGQHASIKLKKIKVQHTLFASNRTT